MKNAIQILFIIFFVLAMTDMLGSRKITQVDQILDVQASPSYQKEGVIGTVILVYNSDTLTAPIHNLEVLAVLQNAKTKGLLKQAIVDFHYCDCFVDRLIACGQPYQEVFGARVIN